MLIAAFDTTGESFSVAVVQGEELSCEILSRRGRAQLRGLIPALEDCLALAGVTLTELEGLAVTVGPGSFTGVRLGVVTAATLAQSLKLRVARVDSLQALACGFPGRVVAAHDARKGEVVAAVFQDGAWLAPRRLLGFAAWSEWVSEQVPCTVVGNALARRPALPAGAVAAPPDTWWVRAWAVARLGQAAFARGEAVGWLELEPEYVRSADVQVHRGG